MKGPTGLHMRGALVEGVGPWMWREADHWAWAHPVHEFPALRDVILRHAKQRRVIVQAGGCMGMYPRLWAEHFEAVYTFEPDPVNFYCLVANCPDPRIIKMQAALSDDAGFCEMDIGLANNAGCGTIKAGGHTPVLTLDSLRFPCVDVIQLDCEGAELKIIEGARHTLAAHRPLISVEAPGPQLYELLGALNYTRVGHCGSMPDVIFAPLK